MQLRRPWLLFWPRSLSGRLTALAIATLLPLSALTVHSYLEHQEDRRAEARRESAEYSRSIAAGLESFAQDLESTALAAALSIGIRPGTISNERDQPFLAALTKEAGVLRSIFVTDLEGQVIAQAAGDNVGFDLSGRSYIRALQAGNEAVWSAGFEGSLTGQVIVAHARVIKGPDNAPIGYLVLAFYPAVLSERLPTPERGSLVLADQEGQLIYSSDGPIDEERRDVSQDPYISAALSGREVSFEGKRTSFAQGDRFGTASPIPSMDWALAYTRSQSRLDAALRNALARDLSLMALIGALSVAALLLTARQVSGPLASLSRAATSLQRGEDVPLVRDSRDPQIARLQEAFDSMRNEVKRREAQLTDQARVVGTLERAGHLLASDLDFRSTVQAVTDLGVKLTEASYGAMIYNNAAAEDDSFQFFTVSGADRSAFEGFGMPRDTGLFGPTFRGEGPVRLDDVLQDPHPEGIPFSGAPPGHPPVRSYLAVPVVSPRGEVLGGLFFGHAEPGRFTERHEELAVGIASWASIALNNARLYEAATEGQKELSKALAAKDEFLGLVSHELRTPITIILGAATHLIERRDEVQATDRETLLADIRENANRLSLLVHNILVLARLDRLGTAGEPVLLRQPVEQAVADFEARAPSRPLTLFVADRSTIVEGSALYVEQILGNLLSNADKYSPAEAPIEVVVEPLGGFVAVSVRDHGPGLSAEESAHVFEPYYRGQTAKERAHGFGLGLPVCKALAEAMGGNLRFQPHPGGGAVFTLELPVLAAGDEAPSTGASESEELVPRGD